MKRMFLKRFGAAFLTMFLLVGTVFGASSLDDYTTRYLNLPGDVDIWVLAWTAHTDGTFTSVETRWAVNGYVYMVITDPGSTAPQALYDITLKDSDGVDIMGGELANRSATDTEQVIPKIGNAYGTRFVNGPLTVEISGNNVNAAFGEIIVYIWGGK